MNDESTDAQAEAQARAKMRDMLLRGDAIKVDKDGIKPANASSSTNAITIPPGKLAIHWRISR